MSEVHNSLQKINHDCPLKASLEVAAEMVNKTDFPTDFIKNETIDAVEAQAEILARIVGKVACASAMHGEDGYYVCPNKETVYDTWAQIHSHMHSLNQVARSEGRTGQYL